MKVTPNPQKLDRLKEALLKHYSKERDEIHVSDLVMCMRQQVYKKVDPKPPTITSVSMFVDGARRDIVIKPLVGKRPETKQVNGVFLTPDAMDDDGPIEVKTTRARYGVSQHYLNQLMSYIVLNGGLKGSLVIQRISMGIDEPFEWYDVDLTEEDRSAALDAIEQRRMALQKALDAKDPRLVPGVKNDAEIGWLCNDCPWKTECYAIVE